MKSKFDFFKNNEIPGPACQQAGLREFLFF